LSCNLKSDKILPYIIKEVSGLKVGIIGVTNTSASQKADGLKFDDPRAAVSQAVSELKAKGANIIVLLSHLGESQDYSLASEVKGIDVVITSVPIQDKEAAKTNADTLFLRPSSQARSLGKLILVVEDNKIKEYKVETLRLSDKINDDQEIKSILPACFSDNDCRKKGLNGVCNEPGSKSSSCMYSQPNKINLTVIVPKPCIFCDTANIVDSLKAQIPGLAASYLYYPGAESQKLIEDLGIQGLPAYLMDKQIVKEKGFEVLNKSLEDKGNFYMLRPQVSGISYFVGRQRIKGKLDLFINLYHKKSAELLSVIREFSPNVHFLVAEQKDHFDAVGGNLEVEECLRSVCVQKYFPALFWDYITCRAKNKNSSWWQDCISGADVSKINECAKSAEGKKLLIENIKLTTELQIMFGPVYLVENQEVFGSEEVPTREEFKKTFNR
jgi:hypothetical protein